MAFGGGRVGRHALDRANQQARQVDIVAGLIHQCAAVELPRPTPLGGVVIVLRTCPKNVERNKVYAPEPPRLDRALEHLQRCVAAVLLDDEQLHARLIALADHAQAVRPARRSEEHTSELPSLMRISYAVFCFKKKTTHTDLN